MAFEATALAMLIALPGATPAHAEDIANAVSEASGGDRLLAAEIVSIGFFESGYLERIQEGRCHKHECDHGRARTWWQFQRTSYSRDAWETSVGLEPEAILEASKVAAAVLRSGRERCHSVEGAIAFYARESCHWSGARYRAKLVNRLLGVRVNPDTAVNHIEDCLFAHPESFGQCEHGEAASCVQVTDKRRVSFFELCTSVSTAAPWVMCSSGATLQDLIRGIIRPSSEKQMVSADASRRVAAMENAQAIRNFSVRKYPGDAVRVKSPAAGLEVPVAIPGRCLPGPALAETRSMCGHQSVPVDLAPEPCDRLFVHELTPRGPEPGRVAAPRAHLRGV